MTKKKQAQQQGCIHSFRARRKNPHCKEREQRNSTFKNRGRHFFPAWLEYRFESPQPRGSKKAKLSLGKWFGE